MGDEPQLPLFDDNPTSLDLLGFGGVVDAVVRVLSSGGLDPVTIGVQSGWGGGKSTLLRLIGDRLKNDERLLVVKVDPWEFDDNQDVRGTLIALVLNALQEEIQAEGSQFPRDRVVEIVTKLDGLRRRIAWGRVAKVLITSAATMTPDIAELVDALTPAPPGEDQNKPQSMAGFREDFAELMQSELGLTRVVVLVDDLDRCLPASAVGTLEAIKLFLSVPKIAFVLAADEDLVRASITLHLGHLARGSSEFADRYTEKIVQVPMSLPRLSQRDAEAYVALLLAGQQSNMSGDQNRAMIERARVRRRAGEAPYAVGGSPAEPGPTGEHQRLASVISRGLSADKWQTPRAVKRFLNNLAIREQIADEAGAHLPLDVLVKMYLLELRHLKELKVLAALEPDKRTALLQRWEDWAHGEEKATKPPEVTDTTQAWALNEPRLAGRGGEIERYLSVAATLLSDVTFGGAMDSEQRKLVENLLNPSDVIRRGAVQDVLGMSDESQDVIVGAITQSLPAQDDAKFAFSSLTQLAAGSGRIAAEVEAVLQRPAVIQKVKVQWVPMFRKMPAVLSALAEAEGLDELVTNAAKTNLELVEKAGRQD